MRSFLKMWAIIALSFNPTSLLGQTEISGGEVSGIWTKAKSPYYIHGDISVTNGNTLQIEPGVRVLFTGYYKLDIQGRLLAIGNKTDSIKFSSINESIKWNKILFDNTPSSNDSSLFSYCIIEKTSALNKDDWSGSNKGFDVLTFSKLKISHSHFRYNDRGPGASLGIDGSNLIVSSCTFYNNDGNAISLSNYGNPLIINNLFFNNNTALRIFKKHQGRFINNIIINNRNTAILIIGEGLVIFNNIILNNPKGAISGNESSTALFINNIIYNNSSDNQFQIYYEGKRNRFTFKNCLIQDGTEAFSGNEEDLKYVDFTTMIDANPLFEYDFPADLTIDDIKNLNFGFKPNSPCINSGIIDTTMLNIPGYDFNGKSRISDGRIDLGAIEYQNASGTLKADFSSSSSSSSTAFPFTVTFNDKSSGEPSLWSWDFGDGSGSNLQNPAHIYSKTGLFKVSLTIRKNDIISTETKLNYIHIGKEIGPGKVEGVWDNNSYLVNGDLTIDNGKTLEIKPGTTILFTGPYKIDVYGRLLALGNYGDSIYFSTVNPFIIKWKSINFYNIALKNDTSKINFCKIEYSNNDSPPYSTTGNSCINIIGKSTKVIISNSDISNNFSGGLYLDNSKAIIFKNNFSNNNSNGSAINISNHSYTLISDNYIYNNDGSPSSINLNNIDKNTILVNNIIYDNYIWWPAIRCNQASPQIINNTIINNPSGIMIEYNSHPILISNIIFNNDDYRSFHNIIIDSLSSADFYNNLVEKGLKAMEGNGIKNIKTYVNNKSDDPQFIINPKEITNDDYVDPKNWSLKQSSPCINEGFPDTTGLNLPNFDFFGNPRIASNHIDMGAIEYQPENDLSVIAWLGKTKSCKFTDKETITARIKNFGKKPSTKFTVSYSSNGGVSYITEEVNTAVNPGNYYDYSFKQSADFKIFTIYPCQVVVNNQGDNILSNDTFKVDIISYQFRSGLNSTYDFCEGKTDTIKATPGLVSYQWTNGNSVSNYYTVSKPGTYSVKVTNAEGCTNQDSTNVYFHPLPAVPATEDKAVCEGSINISLVATGFKVKWYNDSKLSNLISQGNTYLPAISKTGTYPFFVTQTENMYSCTSPSSTIKLVINPQPIPPQANDVYSGPGEINKNLSATGLNIKWYSRLDYSGYLSDGNSYNPNKTDLGTYDYYVTQTVNGCESTPKKISLNILSIPSPPQATDKSICKDKGDSKLHADGINIRWYLDKQLTNLIGTGTDLETGKTNAGEYIYYVSQTINNVQSAIDTVKLTITEIPPAPEAQSVTIFKGQATKPLSATGQNIKWFTDEALTNQVFEGAVFDPGKTDATTYSYYVTQTVNGCESTPKMVEYTYSETTILNNPVLCEGQSAMLEASGQTIKWYADEAKKNLLASGNKIETGKTAPGSYIFYFTQTINNTESNAAKIVLTINPLPPKPEIAQTGQTFCFGDIIKCTNYDKQFSYIWLLNESPIPGESGQEYELKKNLNGKLKLSATNETTKCVNYSDEFLISSYFPEIILKGDNILICKNLENDFKAWQWYLDNQKITNATYQFYEAKQPGEYFTEATNTINCVMKSNKISTLQTFTANLYPTINNGEFNLEIQNNKNEQVNMKVYNIFGLKVNEMILKNQSGSKNIPVSLNGLQPGIYVIEILVENNRSMKRMIVR